MSDVIIAVDKEVLNIYSYLRRGVDILAITPSAMTCLDYLRIKYKNLEDFYSPMDHERDKAALDKSLRVLLNELDQIYSSHVKHPRPYSGNAFWFLHRFAHLLYLSQTARALKNSYESLYVTRPFPKSGLEPANIQMSSLSFPFFGRDVKAVISILAAHLPHLKILDGALGKVESKDCITLNVLLRSTLLRVPGAMKKRLRQKIVSVLQLISKKRGTLLTIQDGYEVNFLKAFMPEYKFYTPINLIIKTATATSPKVYKSLENHRNKLINSFIEEHFQGVGNWLRSFFFSYHKEIVGRLAFLSDAVNRFYEESKPQALLYSIGAANVIEDVFAHQANNRNIPVYYFKHGGADSILRREDLLDKYVERNPNINKTLFVQSSKKLNKLTKIKNTRVLVSGCIERFITLPPQQQINKKILYSYGMPAYVSYKSISLIPTDFQRHTFVKDVVTLTDRNGLRLDIKLNPLDQNRSYNYLKTYIDLNKNNHINIIYGISIEQILKKYGLIIFDMIATRVLPTAVIYDVPIILYLPDNDLANEETLPDLEKRVYIVKNRDELDALLKRFFQGTLDSKWSESFIDEYIFPVGVGNPGNRIADYIKNESNK